MGFGGFCAGRLDGIRSANTEHGMTAQESSETAASAKQQKYKAGAVGLGKRKHQARWPNSRRAGMRRKEEPLARRDIVRGVEMKESKEGAAIYVCCT